MSNRFHNPRPQFMNATPVVYSAGILRFYASGTSTPMNVYSGSDLTGASTTVTLNSAGRPSQDIFLSNLLYKVTLEDSLGNPIWTVDPYMTSDYTTTAKVTGYSGNPNTHVAGTASVGTVPADMVWDRSNNTLYVCTTTGSAAAAVWTVANFASLTNWTTAGRNVSPTAGVDFGYNTTLNALEFWNAVSWISLGKAPTVQTKTSGTAATYTPTAGMVRIIGIMTGPGGGGGARATNAGNFGGNGAGVEALFADWHADFGDGGGTAGAAAGLGGSGGADGTGTLILRVSGGDGNPGFVSTVANVNPPGANGGSNPLGGAGRGGAAAAGSNAKANTGGGGGGGGGVSTSSSGSGGGAGELVVFMMTAAQVGASKTYTLPVGGTGGAGGGVAGGDGGNAAITIIELYS